MTWGPPGPRDLVDVAVSAVSVVASIPSLAELWATVVDYLIYGLGFALQPLPGGLGRALIARGLRLDPPTFSISVADIATCAVNGGRDTLRGSLWLPSGARAPPGPFPVVIVRTPYGQNKHLEFGQGLLAERGYAVLFQDTRGRFGSDGEFVPVEHERDDGAATVRWVREQPWCNGKVAVFGFSYLGFTAWACVGATGRGELQAAIPVITQSRVHSAAFGTGGAIALELVVLWFFIVMRVLLAHSPVGQARAWWDAWRERTISRAHMHTPIAELDVMLLGRSVAFYRSGLAEPDPEGPFWHSRDKLCDHESADLPPMHIITGWYDFFCAECVRDFEAVSALQAHTRLTVGTHDHWGTLHLPHLQLAYRQTLACLDEHLGPALPIPRSAGWGPGPQLRAFLSRLVTGSSNAANANAAAAAAAAAVTITPHSVPSWCKVGGSAHGRCFAREGMAPLHAYTFRRSAAAAQSSGTSGQAPTRGSAWFKLAEDSSDPPPNLDAGGGELCTDADARAGAALPPALARDLAQPVQVCFLGTGRWKGFPTWPPVAATRTELLWLCKSLSLASTSPQGGSVPGRSLEYIYDPAKPTPALGGPAFNPLNSGARNQRALERRSDVLVFTSPPLRRNLAIAGRVRLRLRAASTASSVDFFGRLCEVTGWLGSTNVCEGMVRLHASERGSGWGGASGQEVTIDLGPVAAEFARGSRLRLHVCSAAHPRWMRNLNCDPALPLGSHTCGEPSTQRVWVDDTASVLELPVDSI